MKVAEVNSLRPSWLSGASLGHAACSMKNWWVLSLLLAASLAWAGRDAMNPDGLSYLDIGSEALRQGHAAFVNSYWSPGYPALISLGLQLFQPSAESEFAVVHAINWVIFVFALGAFTFFLKGLLRVLEVEELGPQHVRTPFVPCAFAVFLFFVLRFVGLSLVSPDLLVVGMILLAAGAGCRLLGTSAPSWRLYLFLGLILGLGYYVKAVLFPAGLLLLGLLSLAVDGVRRWRLLASLVVFLGLSLPLILTVSHRAGHLTISDVSRLAYIWYTNRRDLLPDGKAWHGGFGSAYADLTHPPRLLAATPRTLEFSEPVPGTLPLWYEPSYWWAGYPVHFDFRQQLAAFGTSLHALAEIAGSMWVLAEAALVLLFAAPRPRPSIRGPSAVWLPLWWSAAVCALYCVLWIEPRYVAGFAVLFWLGILGLLAARAGRSVSATALAALTCVLLAVTVTGVVGSAARSRGLMREGSNDLVVAARLRKLGIAPGAKLAAAGEELTPYYARIARARVIALIEEPDSFWRLNAEGRRRFETKLADAGIVAIVARERPPTAVGNGWIDVPQNGSPPFGILPISQTVRTRPMPSPPEPGIIPRPPVGLSGTCIQRAEGLNVAANVPGGSFARRESGICRP